MAFRFWHSLAHLSRKKGFPTCNPDPTVLIWASCMRSSQSRTAHMFLSLPFHVRYWGQLLYQDVVCRYSKRCNNRQLMHFGKLDFQSTGDISKIWSGSCSRDLEPHIGVVSARYSNFHCENPGCAKVQSPFQGALLPRQDSSLPEPFLRLGLLGCNARGNWALWLQRLPNPGPFSVALEILLWLRNGRCRHNAFRWWAQKETKLWLSLTQICVCHNRRTSWWMYVGEMRHGSTETWPQCN